MKKLSFIFILCFAFSNAKAQPQQKLIMQACDSMQYAAAKKDYDPARHIDTTAPNGYANNERYLKLPLSDSRESMQLEHNHSDPDLTEYTYQGYIHAIGQYLIHVTYINSAQFFLMDKTTGLITQTLDYIAPSPGKYIAAFDMPNNDTYYGIRVFHKEKQFLKRIGDIKEAGWYPVDIVWASGNSFIIKAFTYQRNQYKYFKVTLNNE